jgi:hypothetical protein
MYMKRIIPFLVLAFALAGCQDEVPTQPGDSPLFGKAKDCDDPKWQDHPSCTGGGGGGGNGGTAKVTLCAKGSVVDYINSGTDEVLAGDPVPSTAAECVIPDPPPNSEPSSLRPSGTLTYTTAGPEFEWSFDGRGFVRYHAYVLIYYPDPWPGTGLVCLSDVGRPHRAGKLRLSGTTELNTDLVGAKIWIVRSNWVDCDGKGFNLRENPDAVPRLTNDASDSTSAHPDYTWPAGADATWSRYRPYNGSLAYDWAFENALIDYDDTDVP